MPGSATGGETSCISSRPGSSATTKRS
jgi:hypothetical protein